MAKQTRKIVRIDENKCDGCGLCVPDCAEGAIQIIDGKARLVAENLCDGLGNCLGACPNDAITIEQQPADEFDEVAVQRHLARHAAATADKPDELPRGCPGTMMRKLNPGTAQARSGAREGPSRLSHWPIQLALLPVGGDIWQDADVLISADCVGFAMPDFSDRLLAGKTLAVACPKLDDIQPYIGKLASIFANNTIRSLTVAHMEVPCCTGIVTLVEEALRRAGHTDIPLRNVTVGIDGSILDER